MRASQIRGGQAAAAVTRLPSAATAAAACRHRQWSDCGPSHVQAAGHLSSQRLHDVARWGDAVQGEGGRGVAVQVNGAQASGGLGIQSFKVVAAVVRDVTLRSKGGSGSSR